MPDKRSKGWFTEETLESNEPLMLPEKYKAVLVEFNSYSKFEPIYAPFSIRQGI
jgi:hypothetical protein